MGRQRKREKILTPNPYFQFRKWGDNRILQAGFESQVFEELQKARGYTNDRLKKFPTDDRGFFSFEDLDAGCTVSVVNRSSDPEDIFKAPNKIRAIYDAESADIVVLHDFKYQSFRGIALAALGVIPYEDMRGVITTIPNTDCSPIYLGCTVDIFESLVSAGHISRWTVSQEDDDDVADV